MGFLDLGGGATSSVQLDFAAPLTSVDRLLLVDIDSNEQYHIEGFALVCEAYVPVSVAGWAYEIVSGSTGVLPDSRWPTWNAATALLTAGASGLNEELSVFTPDAPVSRLVISKTTGGGFSTGIQVIEVTGTAGDYNDNGAVDAADYVVWRENRNTTNVLPNDALGGTIDTPQYNQWRSHFGQTSGSGASAIAAPVPEPMVAVQIIILSAGMSIARCRRLPTIAPLPQDTEEGEHHQAKCSRLRHTTAIREGPAARTRPAAKLIAPHNVIGGV
jgi:hypothetical protein